MQHKTLTVDYGVHFSTVLYPFSIIEIADSLEKRGYELSPSVPFPRPVGRFLGAGEIARKGRTVVQIDSGSQLLLVADISLKSTIDSFNEIVTMLSEDHGIEVGSLIKFYRFGATFEIQTEKEASLRIATNLKVPILKDLEEILKEKISPIEFKFGGSDLRANSENWFDISIRPNYERNDRYVVSIVYRNTEKDRTQAFLRTVEEKVAKIAEFIDK